MGKERNTDKPRHCNTCGKDIVTTADGIMKHAAQCEQENDKAKAEWGI